MVIKSHTIKGRVQSIDDANIVIEFGSVHAEMCFSSTGVMSRKLRLKEDDPVKITIQRF
jgi:hypothetical protein